MGGRYSALSNFGRVPAALMGLDVAEFIRRTRPMVEACAAQVPATRNPGVVLGVILATLAKTGRDKLTLITSPEISGWGPGWSSCWPSPPERTGRASFRSKASRWGLPGSMGRTGCSSTFGWTRPETGSRSRPSGI